MSMVTVSYVPARLFLSSTFTSPLAIDLCDIKMNQDVKLQDSPEPIIEGRKFSEEMTVSGAFEYQVGKELPTNEDDEKHWVIDMFDNQQLIGS